MTASAAPSDAMTEFRAGAFRRARKSFGLDQLRIGDGFAPVREEIALLHPFAAQTTFSRAGAAPGRRFLVAPPLAGGFPVLLRDLVVELLRHSESVAVVDWLDPRHVPLAAGRFGFADNIKTILAAIRAQGPETHVVAVCQGAAPALAATALLAANEPAAAPRSLILIGGPIDPAANPSPVAQQLASRPLNWFREKLITPTPPGFPGTGRRVYSRERQFRTLLGYLARHLQRRGELFWKLAFDEGENPLRFPFWTLISSLMDLTEDFLLEDIAAVYQERALMRGALEVAGERVDPRAIAATALMTIEGADDDLAAPGQTRAAFDLVSPAVARNGQSLLLDHCGHFSLFHGGLCRKQVVPAIVDFCDRAHARSKRVGKKALVA
ncbi:MAG TPA: hypothetical protein VMU18_12640 [Rhodoblastus sp.]|nr:hypothetical protein [Rhodoblastus sp.]